MYTFSKVYIDSYRNFSYDAAINGENALIAKIAANFVSHDDKKFIFFDIGANVGDWTNFTVSRFKAYQGHLFELSQATHKNLKARFTNNPDVTVNNIAASDHDGFIEYKYYGENFGSNTTLMDSSYFIRPHEILKAEAITGTTYCKKHDIEHINFIKIDVEGADFSVLNGFKDYFDQKKIDVVQFEYGYTHADAGIVMRNFFNFFQSRGYLIGRLVPKGVQFKDFEYTDNDFKSGPNYVACLPEFRNLLERF